MRYARKSTPDNSTLTLQGVGHVVGTPAGDLAAGDSLMWNFGHISEIIEIVKQTEKTIVIKVRCRSGYEGERRLLKKRLVCRLTP